MIRFVHRTIVQTFAFSLLLVISCVPVTQQSTTNTSSVAGTAGTPGSTTGNFADKKFRTSDFIYEETIQTVLLYPQLADNANTPQSATLQTAVIPIEQGTPLMLEFDELNEAYSNYHAKIYHCNADWSISLLNDINFIDTYNDFTITDYQLSVATRTPYYHYKLEIPKVKLPGNYIVMVHREGNVKDMMLTRRFMVYDNTVTLQANVVPSSGIQERKSNHQLDFSIQYGNYQITNPREDIKVVLRQNYRWDNAISDLKALNVRVDQKVLDYGYFNMENNFVAGNEFRFFDARSIRFLGTNVAKIDLSDKRPQVLLGIDQSRSSQPYSQYNDFNGMFVVDNYETNRGETDADYVNVIFTLKSPQPVAGNVYVNGGFNNWQLSTKNRMSYSNEAQEYKASILLKQGIYNYNYSVQHPDSKHPDSKHPDESYFEGSYFNTENHYEIIAYYRPVGSRADLIVGYKVIYHNAH